MNPLTNMRNQNAMRDREITMGTAGDDKRSWHAKYKDSAWVYIGGLPYQLTEGDVICVFSQYGEVVNINLVRDRKTGKSKGFAFICYEDQRSTILAVDNFNGAKISGRIIRVDHVEEYKVPKLHDDTDPELKKVYEEGCAPKPLYVPSSSGESEEEGVPEKKPAVTEDEVLPLKEDDDVKAIRKARKAARKEERAKKREEKRKRKLEREAERELKRTGGSAAERWAQRPLEDDEIRPIKATSSYFRDNKGAKPDKEGKIHDDEEFLPEHRVHMNYFDKKYIERRYKGREHQTAADMWSDQIEKLEIERQKKLGEIGKYKENAYVPKRFGKK